MTRARHSRRWAALVALGALLPAGCGYHLASNSAVLPPHTRVIAVLPFKNHTVQPQLSQQISAAVAREFMLRTHDRVQADAAGSDVALHGDLLSVQINPVSFDAATGRAVTVEVVLRLSAWLTREPGGQVLFRNNDLVFHTQYQISSQQDTFVEEDTTAFRRVSRSIAQTLVADIMEAF